MDMQQVELNNFLITSIKKGDIEGVQNAIFLGADANGLDITGRTMIYQVLNNLNSSEGNPKCDRIFQLLLQAGADVRKANTTGAMMSGAMRSCYDVIHKRYSVSRREQLLAVCVKVIGNIW